jgi:D-arabinan endo alpha-(1,5)-arabinofuranosidase
MLPYTHFDGDDGITQIPNDLIHLPDGRYILTAFGVRDWNPVSAGGSWTTWNSRMWTSTDTHAENWDRENASGTS